MLPICWKVYTWNNDIWQRGGYKRKGLKLWGMRVLGTAHHPRSVQLLQGKAEPRRSEEKLKTFSQKDHFPQRNPPTLCHRRVGILCHWHLFSEGEARARKCRLETQKSSEIDLVDRIPRSSHSHPTILFRYGPLFLKNVKVFGKPTLDLEEC